jgi:hypothetical protein
MIELKAENFKRFVTDNLGCKYESVTFEAKFTDGRDNFNIEHDFIFFIEVNIIEGQVDLFLRNEFDMDELSDLECYSKLTIFELLNRKDYCEHLFYKYIDKFELVQM